MSTAPSPDLVIFRTWRKGGEVIALFPELPEGPHGRQCVSYMHVGQHGGADYGHVIAQTRPATVEEAAPLRAELEDIGYTLKVRRRWMTRRRPVT